MVSVSDATLGPAPRSSCTPTAPGAERLDQLGLAYHTVSVPGISDDVAFLLAYEKGAELIVAVGTHVDLIASPALRSLIEDLSPL